MNKTVISLKGYEGNKFSGRRKLFSNWAWVERNKLARSSAPHYREKGPLYDYAWIPDRSQLVNEEVITYLKTSNINMVVSLNQISLPDKMVKLMARDGILYHKIRKHDYETPTKAECIEAEFKMRNRISLIWCGYGQGRTGTMVTAWQILTGFLDKETAIDESTAETPAQKLVLYSLWDPKFTLFIFDLCHALREYDKSSKGGISFGQGRMASMFGVRRSSIASQNIVKTLINIFDSLRIDWSKPVEPKDCREADIIHLSKWNYIRLRAFIEWAVEGSTYYNNFGGYDYGFPEIGRSGVAGATLKALLISAMKNFDKRP